MIMENHPIDNLMKNTMENLKQMVDVNTIVGDAVHTTDGSVIIPVSRVSFGFASGGTEFNKDINEGGKYPFGGGSGAGVCIKPVAFVVLKDQNIRLLSVDPHSTYDKLIDTVPQVIDILKNFMQPKKNTTVNDETKTAGI